MLIKKQYLTLLVSALLAINICSIISSGDELEVIDLFLQIPNCDQISKFQNTVWVRGIWHYVNITLDDEADEISVVFYNGAVPIGNDDRNETNYYEWKYIQNSWNDIQHDYYIREDYCYHETSFYSFYIGIDQYAIVGNWTFELFINSKQLHSEQIYVDNVVTSLALKTIPVAIRAVPFTEDYYISEEKFTVENKGNVPMRLSVNYGSYRDMFSTLDFDELLKPNQSQKYSIMLHSRSTWKPGILAIKAGEASLNGEILYMIPPKKVVSLIESNLSIGLPINVYIGHSGYELESLAGDITFEYVKNLDIFFDETRDIFAYINGNGDVNVDITGQNLEILNIFSGGVEVGSHFTIKSTNTSEYPIAVRVKGIRPNSTAYLYYDLETGGEHQVFTTTINVGSSRPIEVFDATPFIELGLILCTLLVVIYMMYTHIRHKKK